MQPFITHSTILTEPDERLLGILDCINDAVFIHDAETGEILYVNERASELYGYSREELKQQSLGRLSADVPPYTEEEARHRIHQAVHEGAQLFEWHARKSSGQVFWVEINMRRTAILGKPRVVVTARDISTRKRAENELRQSEERFQAVVDNARDPVYCLHLPSLIYDYLSPAVEHVLGFSVDECMTGGLPFILSRLHPDYCQQRREPAALLPGGETDEDFPAVLEYRFLHKTQGYRWISESRSVVRDAQGRAVAVIGNLRDITSSREQEDVEREAHAVLLCHLENTTMAMVECDAHLRVQRWSQQAEKIFGWTAGEISGQHLFGWGLVHPDDLPIVERTITRLLDRSEPRNRCVNRNLSRDGRVIVCEWHNSAIVNDRGEIQSILSLATDVTLERKMTDALRAMGHGMAVPGGEAFFQSLCLHVARILEASHAQVAMLIPEPGRRVRTLGCCAHGKIWENFAYPLAGTPGYEVSAGEIRHYDRDVQAQFPEDPLLREAGATSYMGIPLRGSDGRILGVMSAFHNGVMDTRDHLQAILQIFAARAASEMERLQTEGALRKSEERYALAASGSAGGVWDWDIASGGVYYSPKFKELLGYAPEEFPHSFLAWEQIIHPDDLPRVREAMESHLTLRVPYRVDYRLKSKAGEYRWFETCGQALWDKNGEPRRMAGSNLDIHDRKQVEERVRRLNRLYAVGSATNEAINRVHNPQQLYEAATHIAVQQGLARMAWIGLLDPMTSHIRPVACSGPGIAYLESMHVSILDVPEGRGPAGRAFRTGTFSISNDISQDVNFHSKPQALSNGFLSCAAFPLKPGGHTTGVLVLYADQRHCFEREEIRVLTALADNLSFAVGSALLEQERQQAVEALTEKERMISTLLSNLPGGAAYRARRNGDWMLEFLSQGCHGVTGYDPSVFVGKPMAGFRALMHPEEAAQADKEVAQALERHKPFEVTYRIIAANGQEKWIWERGQGIEAEDGSVQFIEGFLTDVTEKRRMESQILRAQRMESIGTLAGGIAHDLNNVLTPILMSLSLLRTKLTQKRDLELVSTLEASANRGADMVRQIIGFARGVEGRALLMNPQEVVKEIEHLINETFPKAIDLQIHCAEDIANVEGDPTQLHQVLLNLCLNARDAMPEGGRLGIRLVNVTIDEFSAMANPDARYGSYVLFEVTDTGVGIPAELCERIFDPFFTTKELGKGTGLGLSTTLGIVKSHRGFTELTSRKGKGTCFHIYIPAATAGKVLVVTPAAAAPRFGRGELVLVVDDEVTILTATTQTLEAFGYRVITACHGRDALAKYEAAAEKPAVVVTDLMMPVMDGPTMIKALLAIQPDLRFIAASGLSNQLSTQAMALGVKNILLKPYNFEDLLRQLQEHLHSPPVTAAAEPLTTAFP